MKKFCISVSLMLLLLFSGCATTSMDVIPEVQEMYSASISVLNDKDKAMGAGTIILNKSSHYMVVITAAHVIKERYEKRLNVNILYEDRVKSMTIYKYDAEKDLALLVGIEKEKQDGPFVNVAKESPKIGQKIWVIGAPLGKKKTVTVGIISNKIEDKNNILYRTDAEVFFGNSGGGMFNEDGELVGVLHAITILQINPFCVLPEPGGHYAVGWEMIRKFL